MNSVILDGGIEWCFKRLSVTALDLKRGEREKQQQLRQLQELFLCARVLLCAAGTHADTQNSLPDRHGPGLPAQEEHHLLRPQVRQHFGVVPGCQGARQHQALRLRHLAAVVPRGRAGRGGHPRLPGPRDPAPHRLRWKGDLEGTLWGSPGMALWGCHHPMAQFTYLCWFSHCGFPCSPLHPPTEPCPDFPSVSGCRWTCSPMGWSCMSYCRGRGLCWDTTSSRLQRNCPKGSVLSSGSPRRCSSTGCRHSWWSVGTLNLKRYKTTLLTPWLPSSCRRAELAPGAAQQLHCLFTPPADLAQNFCWLKWEFYEWNDDRFVALDICGDLKVPWCRWQLGCWFHKGKTLAIISRNSSSVMLWAQLRRLQNTQDYERRYEEENPSKYKKRIMLHYILH